MAAYRAALTDGERLVLGYTALVTDDAGEPLGTAERWAAVRLADLAAGPAVESLPVERLPAPPAGARPLALRAAGEPALAGPHVLVLPAGGRHTALVLRHGPSRPPPPLHSGALARTRTAAWVWPLLPLALAVDAVTNPVLLFFAPAVMAVGE